ncbi:hypothetical protein DFH08DRAFT_818950 [Mycena albidolilacea]|uniref:Uncharacterized protein n=1 Tax=Mycena albidolilacea TaxID=1033008 RepID=A0AAD6ZET0_9AGAR|nr:hypothetical protein DFH08DRAFT_818950 [Mycena albidolilacea]
MSGRRVLQPTTLGQLGDDCISDQLSHQFDLKSVRGNDSGVESLACVGIGENWGASISARMSPINLALFLLLLLTCHGTVTFYFYSLEGIKLKQDLWLRAREGVSMLILGPEQLICRWGT